MTQVSNKIEQAISSAEDLYVREQRCDTEDWSIVVAGNYDQLVQAMGTYCEETGVTITADRADLGTPEGLQPGARFQLVNNPMSRLSSLKIQYVLERLGFYLIAVAESPALMVIGPDETTVYSKEEIESEED